MTFRRTFGLGATTQQYLSLISQYESGNQNIPNYRYDPTHTAQGYYQITNTNWNNVAPLLGIDTSVYPDAMSAPQNVQAQVAAYLLTQTPGGISNWSNYNPQLQAALSTAGLQTSGTVTDWSGSAPAGSGPLVDISGAAASTPTATILDQLQASAASAGIDLTSPVTDAVIAGGVGLLALLLLRN